MDWESQPPELKALGKRAAERVIKRRWTKIFERANAKVKAKHATMTPEQIAKGEQIARDYVLSVVLKHGPAERWFDKS